MDNALDNLERSRHHLLAALLPKEQNLKIRWITFKNLNVGQALLTPLKTPTTSSDTVIRVEKDMDDLCDAG